MGELEIELVEQSATAAERQRLIASANVAVVLLIVFLGVVAFVGSLVGGELLGDASNLTIAGITCLAALVFVGVPITVFNVLMGRQSHEIKEASVANEQRMMAEARWRRFETQLANAFEMADGEPEALDAVRRALHDTLPSQSAEFLLADNSHAHLRRMVVSAPNDEPPGCTVDSPENCPAARRAQVQRFPDSARLDACPKLRRRPQGECSAVCVPVSIMGRTVGVIHATSAPDTEVDDETIQNLQTLANQAGTRIGLLRIMAETQLQAATDSLTGLLNRRALENRVYELRRNDTPFSLAMADLDHFKKLNDTHGHETGDRALRIFAQTLKSSLRSQDLVARHGGEEFAIVLPDCSATHAAVTLDQTRANLTRALQTAGLPAFTASIGIVEAGSDEELKTILERADGALFEAKRLGRDRIVIHGDELADPSGPENIAELELDVPRGSGRADSNGQHVVEPEGAR